MSRIALPLLLAVSSLAFAPAPLPRPDRETPAQKRERRLAECRRRLDELGVTWRLEVRGGRPMLRYSISHPNAGGRISSIVWAEGDLADELRNLVEPYLRKHDRLLPP